MAESETITPELLPPPSDITGVNLLHSVWKRLDDSEKAEPSVSLRDDLRIAKLFILNG